MIEKQFSIVIQFDLEGPAAKAFPFTQDQYLRAVRADLERILRSEAGRYLAASLRFHKKRILLVPYPDGDSNAQEWAWGSDPRENNSMVRFTPGSGRAPCCAELRKKRPATLSHEGLFHELVHSLRRISGKMRNWSLERATTLHGHGNIEEFIAILVTNIFISDVSNTYKTSLREDWNGHAPIDPDLAESYRFFSLGTKAFNLIATFCADNPGFTQMLSRVRARFNPVAAYYHNRRQAFEMAVSGDAEQAFKRITPFDYAQDPAGVWRRLGPFPTPSPQP